MTEVDFHFDVMCPWAYQASKWIREAAGQREISVRWRFFSLEEINRQEGKKHPWEREWSYGWSMLRVAAMLRRQPGGNEAVDRFYAVAGRMLHEEGQKVHTPDGVKAALGEIGLNTALVDEAIADPTTHDDVRADHDRVVELGGFGVPTLVLDGTTTLFGPVITPAPTGEAAGRLWDLVAGWIEFPHLHELGRPKTDADRDYIRQSFTPYFDARDSAVYPKVSCMKTLADNSAAGMAAQLDEVWSSLQSLGESMTTEEWSLPTSCPGWSVANQYIHVLGAEHMLLDWQVSDTIRPTYDEDWVLGLAQESKAEVLRLFAEVTAARRAELAELTDDDLAAPSWTPSGPDNYRRLLQVRAFDCWVHDQDVRDAVGRPALADGQAAVQAFDEIVRALGYIVGKKAGSSEGESVRFELTPPLERIEQVVVADGRAKVVDRLDGQPTVVLRLSSTAFARLACGRVDSAAVLAGEILGGVEIDGDEDLGRRVIANMTFTFGPKSKEDRARFESRRNNSHA